MCEMCHPWSWPRQPITSESYHMTSFYEGSFLCMILDKLSRMLDQVLFFFIIPGDVIINITTLYTGKPPHCYASATRHRNSVLPMSIHMFLFGLCSIT